MRIAKIHIDGFGNYHEKTFTVAHPLTIFFGENGIGKSTLVNFVRTMLVGFPNKKYKEYHPPFKGGRHGGRMEIVSDNGQSFILGRYSGRDGGDVSVTYADDGKVGPDARALVGYVTSSTFQSIFSFDSQALEGLGDKTDGNVTDHFYGVSTSAARVPKALKSLGDQEAAIYTKRKSNKAEIYGVLEKLDEIESELRDLKNQSDGYGDATLRHQALANEIETLTQKKRASQSRLDVCERYNQQWNTWLKVKDLEQRLSELPRQSRFPEDPISRLDLIEQEIETNKETAERHKTRLKAEKDKGNSAVVGAELLEQEAQVKEIERKQGQYASCVNDLPKQEAKWEAERNGLERDLRELGQAWTEERIKEFDISIPMQDELKEWDARRNRTKDACNQAEGAFNQAEDAYAKQGSGDSAKSSDGNDRLRKLRGFVAVTVFGLLGVWTGLSFVLEIPWYFSLGVVALLLLFYWFWRGQSSLEQNTNLETLKTWQEGLDEAKQKLEQRRQEIKKEDNEWLEWKLQRGFPKDLRAESGLRFLEKIKSLHKSSNAAQESGRRVYGIRTTIKEYEDLVNTIAKQDLNVSDESQQDEISLVDQIIKRFSEAKDGVKACREAKSRAEETAHELETAQNKLTRSQDTRDELIKEGEAKDSEEFRRKASDYQEYQQYKTGLENEKSRLRNAWMGEYGDDALRKMFEATKKESVDEEINDLRLQLKNIEETLDSQKNESGQLQERITTLSNNERASQLRAKREECRKELQCRTEQWSKLVVARTLLDRVRTKYEDEHQPAVIRHASTWFKAMTKGGYGKIRNVEDDKQKKAVRVVDRSKNIKSALDLSTGEKHRLYLALRFGLINKFTEEGESLPVIVDDALAQIDHSGALIAAKGFIEFSQKNQVFVLTCHRWVVDVFKEVSADVPVVSL